MLQGLDDRALMLRYRDDGDATAFEVLYTRHRGPLYRYLLRQCGEPELAQDLFQETWMKIIRHRERYRPTAKFGTYLYRVAHNCLVDRIRSRNRQPADEGGAISPDDLAGTAQRSPEDEAGLAESAARLRVALDALAPEQREAFLLHEESGLSLEEIAGVVGVGRETVKSRLRYAVNHLRRRLSGQAAEMTGTVT